eukprot:2827248-Prorocentrum_lima.AAC.1
MRATEFGELMFIDHVELVVDKQDFSVLVLVDACPTSFGLAGKRTRRKCRRFVHVCGARTSSW